MMRCDWVVGKGISPWLLVLVVVMLCLSVPTPTHALVPGEQLFTWSDPEFRMRSDKLGAVQGTLPSTNDTLWSVAVNATVLSSPVVWQGRVYVGTMDGRLLCLSATSGAIIREARYGSAIESTPACDGAWVYFCTDDGRVYCLNTESDYERWNYSTGTAIKSSPTLDLLHDDRICLYVGSNDFKVYCLNLESGEPFWNLTTGSYIYSSPAVFRDIVYFGSCDGRIYAVNWRNGTVVWTFQAQYAPASPAVTEDGVFIGTFDKRFYCLNRSTGKEIWNFSTEGQVYSSAAVDPEGGEPLVCVCDDVGNLYLREGNVLTKYPLGLGGITSSPGLVRNNLTGGRSVVVATKDGYLTKLTISLGAGATSHSISRDWTIRIGTSISSSPFFYNGRIYVSAVNGEGGIISCIGAIGEDVKVSFEEPLEESYLLPPSTFRVHVQGGPFDTVDVIINSQPYHTDLINGSWTVTLNALDFYMANGRTFVLAEARLAGSFMGAASMYVYMKTFAGHGPTVTIGAPMAGKHIDGVIIAHGTATSDPKWPVLKVEMGWDSTGNWTAASGLANWTAAIDTASLSEGNHTLRVRAFDGYVWGETSVKVHIGGKTEGRMGWQEGLADILLVSTLVLIMLARPRSRPRT